MLPGTWKGEGFNTIWRVLPSLVYADGCRFFSGAP
jgi:hypothetical protein